MGERHAEVYHASEAPDIDVFHPRRYWHIEFGRSGPLRNGEQPPEGAGVICCFYASSRSYVPFYYASKAYPRLLVSRARNPSSFDRMSEVVESVVSDRVMFFRDGDRERLQSHTFTVYRFRQDQFERLPNGEYVAHQPVTPSSRTHMRDVLACLETEGYQLEFGRDLEKTRDRLLPLGLVVDSEGVRVAT